MAGNAGTSREKRDWKVSVILLAVWIVALFVVSRRSDVIPLSMIAMASVFFVLLIPAMNDLVRSIEQYVERQFGGTRINENQNESR